MMFGPDFYAGRSQPKSENETTEKPSAARTLYRQLPSAITYSTDADDPYRQLLAPDADVVLSCCSAVFPARSSFRRCLRGAWDRTKRHWKIPLLLLLLLFGMQMFAMVTLYKQTDSVFCFNMSSPLIWSTDGKPVFESDLGKIRSPDGASALNQVSRAHSQENASRPELRPVDTPREVRKERASHNMTATVPRKSLLSDELPLCPPVPPDLKGPVHVDTSPVDLLTEESRHPELLPGGRWRPPNCQSRHRVAVIIPYRERAEHLAILLRHLHPFLQRQELSYGIFVVEQAGSGKFNRAMLMNVGALESVKLDQYSCYIFHDIDLLPEDDRNLYSCPQQPRHMSVAIDVMHYELPYNDIFGGVSAMSVDHVRGVNGFSNKFWGWGGEDDDMSNRLKHHGYYISRYPANIARYTMLSHKKQNPNPQRYQILTTGKKRFQSDGLNSIRYRVLDVQLRRLFTWIYVELQKS